MHDIDRGGSTTAVRLAALAALRNAQADSTLAEEGEAEAAEQRGGHDGRGRHPRAPESNVPDTDLDTDPDTTHRFGQDLSAGVYAAVEAAVKKSRIEFMARLLEYRRKLDCDAFKAAGPDGPCVSLDEAQFVAHRIAGVGKTRGFADLGDTARQAEAAITAYKLESSADLRQAAVSRICKLMGLIETTCAENDDCRA